MHNIFRVKALPSPFPSLGFTGRPVFSPRPCPSSHAFDASPPQTAKGEGKKTKTFTPNAHSLNKLRKAGEAVKAKNENLWTRARARKTCIPSRFPRCRTHSAPPPKRAPPSGLCREKTLTLYRARHPAAADQHKLPMSARLLWVDDEIDLLRPHCLFLEKRGYDIATATNGNDAVELCRTQRFDLVLLDENMPGLSGLETLAAIKEVQPDVPVVMVTKNEAEDLMDQAIGAQIADYLLKPVNPMQILMALKKNIHRHEIVQEQTESGYRREFAQLALDMDAADDAAAWVELYKRLVHWELQLAAGADGAMADLLRDQKEEANAAFAKFVKANYADWVADADAPARPTLSPDVLRRAVFPRLAAGRRVVLLVLDNFRYDQWRVLAPELAADFDAEEQVYFSILPTATQYARNALFAGMMPLDIARTHPDLWVDEEAEEGKNLHEAELLERQLARLHRRPTFAYHKLNDSAAVDKWLASYDEMRSRDLSVAVINFIDILSHARTESRMVRELASNEAAYRSITLSWFRHTGLRELFRRLAADDADVVLTTDHGSIRVDRPVKVVGDRNVNTNLRYKLGRNLSYPAKEVFEVRNPADLRLPAPNLSTTYIFATGARFFAYPNNYNYYVQHFRDTFQHGGVSMEEMIVPLITLHPKGR